MLLLAGIGILVLHFLLIVFSVNPFIKEKSRINYWADYYVNPFFQQTWTLFTPPPNSNFNLIASYEKNGYHTEDVFTRILGRHQSNRLLGYEPLLLSFLTSIHYFEETALINKQTGGLVKNDTNFDMIEHMTRNYLRYTCGGEVNNLKLTLVINDLQSNQPRIYFN